MLPPQPAPLAARAAHPALPERAHNPCGGQGHGMQPAWQGPAAGALMPLGECGPSALARQLQPVLTEANKAELEELCGLFDDPRAVQ